MADGAAARQNRSPRRVQLEAERQGLSGMGPSADWHSKPANSQLAPGPLRRRR